MAALLLVAACSGSSDSSPTPTDPLGTLAPPDTEPAPTTTALDAAPATFDTLGGVHQVAVLGAEAGADVEVLGADDQAVAQGVIDEQGSFLARSLAAGTYRVVTRGAEAQVSEPVEVVDADVVPDQSFYSEQRLPAPGFGYVTTRDGTTLSATVWLPGKVEDGPYPTVVEYSGYSPSNPDDGTFAQIYNTMGYAYVGVNMRGTGCSGGSFRFFEEMQVLDGYDMIEAIAAQPWVLNNKVGMVGISYPGISQLFVASSNPPSLAAITPLSVLDDSYRSTLYPGGILNTGFAVEWTSQRLRESAPYGQGWEQGQVDNGDTTCESNQLLRLQNPDLLAEIRANPYYSNPLGDSLAPATFVDRIDVPVFLAGAWQDEQTGGKFPDMLDRFTGSPHFYATLVNGLHTESLAPAVFPRYAEFLDLYVAHRTPTLAGARLVAPILSSAIYGAASSLPETDRFAGMTYEQALATFESEPPIQVLFEEGAKDGAAPGSAEARYSAGFASWPIPGAVATTWFLSGDGNLSATAPTATDASSDYTADPSALPETFYDDSGPGIWNANVKWDWRPIPDGKGLTFVSEPLAATTVFIGGGSADLWVGSSSGDTDLEVSVIEVRPDGTEVYVQSGWQRASQRALDDAASTALRPVHTNLEADAELLPSGELSLVRVEIFPFAHAFRAGSRLKITIDAPGNSRGEWIFESISDGETVTIGHDASHLSAIVLSAVPGVSVPATYPACGSLRGQPCRLAG